MDAYQKTLLKAAQRIQAQYAKQRQWLAVQLPDFAWRACQRLVRLIGRANVRGWSAAVRELSGRLQIELTCLRNALDDQLRRLEAFTSAPGSLPRLKDLYEDIVSLSQEFDETDCDLNARTLSVVTDPIVLEGMYLGPFEIVLDWGQLGRPNSAPYRVIAREPHPAGSSSEVVHPHMQGEGLCAGEGAVPLRKALEQGRLADFFLIAAQVLATYNAGSAYVSLSEWDGPVCGDCGTSMSPDDANSCGRCGSTLCLDCEAICTVCHESSCAECGLECSGCNESCCERCMDRCAACGDVFCNSCLTDGRCTPCHGEETIQGSGGSGLDGAEPQGTGARRICGHSAGTGRGSVVAVHPVCVGQTAVPAGSG